MSNTMKDISICPKYEKAFSILGKRWNALIIDVLDQKECRFCELARSITELSDRVLTERLRELEKEEIIEKKCTGPSQYMYTLTPKGKELASSTNAIKEWAEKWIDSTPCE